MNPRMLDVAGMGFMVNEARANNGMVAGQRVRLGFCPTCGQANIKVRVCERLPLCELSICSLATLRVRPEESICFVVKSHVAAYSSSPFSITVCVL
jgi:hypothetical protein